MNNIFYVYVYLDPRKKGVFKYGGDITFNYEPFYVGKGKLGRYRNHLKPSQYNSSSNYKNNKIKSILNDGLEPIIIKYYDKLIEDESFRLEIKLIESIGRFDLHLGPLCNFTNGGESGCGQIMSKKTKEKLSKINKGQPNRSNGKTYEEIYGVTKAEEIKSKLSRIVSGKTYEEIYGVKKAEEIKEKIKKGNLGKIYNNKTREKIRQNSLGRKMSDETKYKISNSLRGKPGRNTGNKHTKKTKKQISESKKGIVSWNAKPVLQISREGEIIKEWRSATHVAKQLNLSQGNIQSVINGNRKTCGGFIWKLKSI